MEEGRERGREGEWEGGCVCTVCSFLPLTTPLDESPLEQDYFPRLVLKILINLVDDGKWETEAPRSVKYDLLYDVSIIELRITVFQ